jgi:hypothetical protein
VTVRASRSLREAATDIRIRSFPSNDALFASHVAKLTTTVMVDADECIERVERQLRQTYPAARIVRQHALAQLTAEVVSWYAYRDGVLMLANDGGPTVPFSGPQGRLTHRAR